MPQPSSGEATFCVAELPLIWPLGSQGVPTVGQACAVPSRPSLAARGPQTLWRVCPSSCGLQEAPPGRGAWPNGRHEGSVRGAHTGSVPTWSPACGSPFGPDPGSEGHLHTASQEQSCAFNQVYMAQQAACPRTV